jgi:hypothetical protein
MQTNEKIKDKYSNLVEKLHVVVLSLFEMQIVDFDL